ncbi:hypothetical protein HGB13_05215, partial [bacterium]|nr:hypothetical protein [bacterium]
MLEANNRKNAPDFKAIHPAKPLELERYVEQPEIKNLGPLIVRDDIESLKHTVDANGSEKVERATFNVLPEHITYYPDTVLTSLAQLHAEYNVAFAPLIEKNREWDTDYQYCLQGPGGTPVNYFVQIDMVGLPHDFLNAAASQPIEVVLEQLRNNMFEIENSVAMYQLLGRMFSNTEGRPANGSRWGATFREGLDVLRQKFNKPIALLAVTEQKNEAMRESEFGKAPGEPLTDEEVYTQSGFDTFMGPDEFAQHVRENGGDSAYLLYVRSSHPTTKLKNPSIEIHHPLLGDADMRRIIKANTLTMNIDDPAWNPMDGRMINDTKEHLPTVGMGFPVYGLPDLSDPAFNVLINQFKAYLLTHGADPDKIDSGELAIHFKPMLASYGAYGHGKDILGRPSLWKQVAKEISRRGPYILQREMKNPKVVNINATDGRAYIYINRNFF